MIKPKVKPIHRILALPFQIIGFVFFMVFFLTALISAPWRTKQLIHGILEEMRK
jgi:hypothetical protein